MANEKKKVTNTNNKNKKTTTKNTQAKKTTTAKKAVAAKKGTAKKATTTKTQAKKTTAPKKKVTTAKKTATVATKKDAKKVANNTKNTTKKTAPKKTVKKQVPKKVVEPKKVEAKVEITKEVPKKVEKTEKASVKKETKITDKKLTLSTSTIYTIIGLVVLAIVIILSIFINPSSGKYEENNNNNTGTNYNSGSPATSEDIPEDKRKELNVINIDQYLEMLQGEEAKVIYIGRPTCSHCVAQKPVMENISFEYDVTINYLNTDDLDDNGIEKLISSNEYFSEGFGTPLTLIVKNNQIVDKAVGETSKSDMVKMFKNNSIIK